MCDIVPKGAGVGESAMFLTIPTWMMMEKEQIDAVSVLTPSGLHAKHVLNLVKYKSIYWLKTMALTLDDADAMIRECAENHIKLFVVKQNRCNVPVKKLHEALEAGRFGKLVLGTVRVRWCRTQDYYDQDAWRGTWAYDGGVFANQASHHIDLLEWMMGEVDTVFARSATALVNIETEDTVVLLNFETVRWVSSKRRLPPVQRTLRGRFQSLARVEPSR